MQCDCKLSANGKSFSHLCDMHYALKIKAMGREREFCKDQIQGALDICKNPYGKYQDGLREAQYCIDAMCEMEAGIDDHSFK